MSIPQNPYTFGLVISVANGFEQQAADNKAASDIWDVCSKAWANLIVKNWNHTEYTDVVKEVYAIVAFPIEDFEALKKLAEEKDNG
jgi:hypothetical protein